MVLHQPVSSHARLIKSSEVSNKSFRFDEAVRKNPAICEPGILRIATSRDTESGQSLFRYQPHSHIQDTQSFVLDSICIPGVASSAAFTAASMSVSEASVKNPGRSSLTRLRDWMLKRLDDSSEELLSVPAIKFFPCRSSEIAGKGFEENSFRPPCLSCRIKAKRICIIPVCE